MSASIVRFAQLFGLGLLLLQLSASPVWGAGVDTKEAELKQVRTRIESIRKAPPGSGYW